MRGAGGREVADHHGAERRVDPGGDLLDVEHDHAVAGSALRAGGDVARLALVENGRVGGDHENLVVGEAARRRGESHVADLVQVERAGRAAQRQRHAGIFRRGLLQARRRRDNEHGHKRPAQEPVKGSDRFHCDTPRTPLRSLERKSLRQLCWQQLPQRPRRNAVPPAVYGSGWSRSQGELTCRKYGHLADVKFNLSPGNLKGNGSHSGELLRIDFRRGHPSRNPCPPGAESSVTPVTLTLPEGARPSQFATFGEQPGACPSTGKDHIAARQRRPAGGFSPLFTREFRPPPPGQQPAATSSDRQLRTTGNGTGGAVSLPTPRRER